MLIGAVAVLQLGLAHRYFGFLTGDDVEILAEAFRRAFGFAYQPWDVRNLFVPDVVIAPVVWVAHAIGIRDPARLIEAAALPGIAATAVTIALVHRLALRWSEGDELAAKVAALLFALHWLPLAFGSTVYPRTIATMCTVAAAVFAGRGFLSGALAGLAFADRFSEGVFIIPLFIITKRRVLLLAGFAVAVLLTVGLYDWLTWGEPFGSVHKFAHLTVVEPDFASRIKYQSPTWYLETLPRWCALTLLPLFWAARRKWQWVPFVIVPILALSAIRHKEMRYLQGIVPYLAIGAAIGFAVLWRAGRRPLAVALLVIAIPWNLYGLKYLGRKSMPAVMAARALAADPHVRTITLSQLWAYGDRLYFGDDRAVRDILTPPRDLAAALPGSDAVCLYESDLTPDVVSLLRAQRFARTMRFDTGEARAVIVFVPSTRRSAKL